jgi:hypothetical protein
MKNKNNIETEYQSAVEEVFKSLHKLNSIMNRPDFEEYAGSDEAIDQGNVYGSFEDFINETAEAFARG